MASSSCTFAATLGTIPTGVSSARPLALSFPLSCQSFVHNHLVSSIESRSVFSVIGVYPKKFECKTKASMAEMVTEKGKGNVKVFESEEDLAVSLAKYTADLSDKFAKERGAFTVALSGGSLIKSLRFYKAFLISYCFNFVDFKYSLYSLWLLRKCSSKVTVFPFALSVYTIFLGNQ